MPMDRSAVKAIVDDHLKFMRWDMQLQDWHLVVDLETIDGNALANCKPENSYQIAYITIDPSKHEDEDEVLNSLRHEMIHAMIGEFETYRKAVCQLVSDREFHALDEMFVHCTEKTVGRVERMLDHGLQIPAGKREIERDTPSPYVEEEA